MNECRLCLKKSERHKNIEFYHITDSDDEIFQGVKEIFEFNVSCVHLIQ